jgi:multicomponent Na+:H+ antiporter subunit E
MYVIFLLLWIVFNGQFTLEILLFGVAVAAAIFWFICKFMDYSVEKEKRFYKMLGKLLTYAVTLVWEIVKANFATIHMILTYREENEPVLVRFKTRLKTDTARAYLANSITLTPGTITVTLTGDEYLVHALDADFALGMDESVFVDKLTALEQMAEAPKEQNTKIRAEQSATRASENSAKSNRKSGNNKKNNKRGKKR